MSFVRHLAAIPRDRMWIERAHARLQLSRDEQRAAQLRVLERLMAEPAPGREPIRSLEALPSLPLVTSDEVLPTDPAHWEDLTLEGVVSTSGSSGRPKHMPVGVEWLTRATDPLAAFIAPRVLALHERGITTPKILALTAPPGFVTHLAIPWLARHCGCEVFHVPLPTVLSKAEAASELAAVILEHQIDGIITMAPMVFPMLDALQSVEGASVTDKLTHDCSFGVFGGTEIQPRVEALLRRRIGGVDNVLASTECLVLAASHPDQDVKTLFVDPSYVIAGVLPEGADRYLLLDEAPPGTIGELVVSLPATVPWVNLRTQDYIKVLEPHGGYATPAFEYYARECRVLNVGGARLFGAELHEGMQSLGLENAFLAMEVHAGEASVVEDLVDHVAEERLQRMRWLTEHDPRDVLEVYVDDREVPLERVLDAILEHTYVFGPVVRIGRIARVQIRRARPGAIDAAIDRNPGMPALKDRIARVVRIRKYTGIPFDEVLTVNYD